MKRNLKFQSENKHYLSTVDLLVSDFSMETIVMITQYIYFFTCKKYSIFHLIITDLSTDKLQTANQIIENTKHHVVFKTNIQYF